MLTNNVNIPIPQSTLQNATVPNITVNVNTVSTPVIEREPIFTLVYRGIDDKQLIPLATLVAICVLSSLLAHSFGIPRFLRQNSDKIFEQAMDDTHNYHPSNPYKMNQKNQIKYLSSCSDFLQTCAVVQAFTSTDNTGNTPDLSAGIVRSLYLECKPTDYTGYEKKMYIRGMRSFTTLFGASIFSSTTYAQISSSTHSNIFPSEPLSRKEKKEKMSKMHLLLFGLVVELVGVGLPFMLCGVPFAILLWKQYRYIRDIEILKAIATRQTILNAIDALEQHELYTVRMNNIYTFLIITGVIHISRILFINVLVALEDWLCVNSATELILGVYHCVYFWVLIMNTSWILWPYASNFNILNNIRNDASMLLMAGQLIRSIIGFMYQTVPAEASAKFAAKREILATIPDENLTEEKMVQTKEMISIFATT
jgi:hypothetical protein